MESMLAVCREAIPAMNLCMQTELADQPSSRRGRPRSGVACATEGLPRANASNEPFRLYKHRDAIFSLT